MPVRACFRWCSAGCVSCTTRRSLCSCVCWSVASSDTRSKVNDDLIVVHSVVTPRLYAGCAYLFRTGFFIVVGLEFIFLMVVSVSFLYFEETMRRRDFVKCVRLRHVGVCVRLRRVRVCVYVRVCACVRACACVCVCVCVYDGHSYRPNCHPSSVVSRPIEFIAVIHPTSHACMYHIIHTEPPPYYHYHL